TEGGNLIAQLGNGLITAIPQLLMQAQILMSQLILWLREQFPTILQNGVEFILNFANGFFEALPSVLSNIGQILNQVLVAIFAAIPSILQSGYDLIVGLAKGIWSNYPEIITRITNILAGLLQTILEHMPRSEEHTSELQSRFDLVCRLLLEKKIDYDIIRHLYSHT